MNKEICVVAYFKNGNICNFSSIVEDATIEEFEEFVENLKIITKEIYMGHKQYGHVRIGSTVINLAETVAFSIEFH